MLPSCRIRVVLTVRNADEVHTMLFGNSRLLRSFGITRYVVWDSSVIPSAARNLLPTTVYSPVLQSEVRNFEQIRFHLPTLSIVDLLYS